MVVKALSVGEIIHAYLYSPWMKAEDNQCLQFMYHLHALGIGQLLVFIQYKDMYKKKLWERKGLQGNKWFKQQLQLPAGEYRLVFIGVRGFKSYGGISVDEISVSPRQCDSACECELW